MKKTPFIDDLDARIRDVVLMLRDHGFNTFCSCEGGNGHSFERPTVQMEYDGLAMNDMDQAAYLHSVLLDNGRERFEIRISWRTFDGMIIRSMEVEFLDN